MNRFTYLFQKLLSFLRVRFTAGGLEVSDQVLRLVYFDGKVSRIGAIRLEPGVVEKGKIKNQEAFAGSLRALKASIAGMGKKKKINVVVSLSSVNIYSQVFTLPFLEGKELDEAIKLNVQMLSPTDAAGVYSGWQFLGRDEDSLRLEFSAAFVDKQLIDDMAAALFGAGFIAVAVESRAFSLMRMLNEKESGINVQKSYILVEIDNSGIDFLIVRKGRLYFEYANQWSDIADDKGQIPALQFEDALAASLRQVTNFHDQHWPEPLAAIILSASAFGDLAKQAIAKANALPVIIPSVSKDRPVSPEWLVAQGASLRGFRSAARDGQINLLGEGATETFQKEQFINFLNLWRVLVPIALGILVLTFFLTNLFLTETRMGIASDTAFPPQPSNTQIISSLEASSTAFNQSVALVKLAEGSQSPKYNILADILSSAASSSITVGQISFQGGGTPLLFMGSGPSEDAIVAFKNAIQSDPLFGPVMLPLTEITQNGQSYSFSMTFPVSQ